jgi:putative phage-type endonuclease
MGINFYTTEQDWLQARGDWIGASEVAAVLGANKYQSALGIYASKTNPQAIERETAKMRAGKMLESSIAHFWAAETNMKIVTPAQYAGAPDGDRVVWSIDGKPIAATPDFFAVEDGTGVFIVEIKNISPILKYDDEGCVVGREAPPSWINGAPLMYVMQVMQQMAVLRANGVDVSGSFLVAYFGGDDVREFFIEFDEALWHMCEECIEKFWNDHVVPRNPPPIDQYTTPDMVARAWRKAIDGKRVEVPVALVTAYRDAKERLSVHEQDAEAAKAALQAAMGDAEIATCNDIPCVTWKNQTQVRPAQAERTIQMRVLRMSKHAQNLVS